MYESTSYCAVWDELDVTNAKKSKTDFRKLKTDFCSDFLRFLEILDFSEKSPFQNMALKWAMLHRFESRFHGSVAENYSSLSEKNRLKTVNFRQLYEHFSIRFFQKICENHKILKKNQVFFPDFFDFHQKT